MASPTPLDEPTTGYTPSKKRLLLRNSLTASMRFGLVGRSDSISSRIINTKEPSGADLDPLRIGDVIFLRDDVSSERSYLSADAMGRDVIFLTTTRSRHVPGDFRQCLWRICPELAYEKQEEQARFAQRVRALACELRRSRSGSRGLGAPPGAGGMGYERDDEDDEQESASGAWEEGLDVEALLLASGSDDSSGDDAATRLVQAYLAAKRRAGAERELNAEAMERVVAGTERSPVVYGTPIQLQHIGTGLLLCGEEEPATVWKSTSGPGGPDQTSKLYIRQIEVASADFWTAVPLWSRSRSLDELIRLQIHSVFATFNVS